MPNRRNKKDNLTQPLVLEWQATAARELTIMTERIITELDGGYDHHQDWSRVAGVEKQPFEECTETNRVRWQYLCVRILLSGQSNVAKGSRPWIITPFLCINCLNRHKPYAWKGWCETHTHRSDKSDNQFQVASFSERMHVEKKFGVTTTNRLRVAPHNLNLDGREKEILVTANKRTNAKWRTNWRIILAWNGNSTCWRVFWPHTCTFLFSFRKSIAFLTIRWWRCFPLTNEGKRAEMK